MFTSQQRVLLDLHSPQRTHARPDLTMAAARSKVPAIGSAQWILEERHQSNDLVAQELEDFGFSVRNELEWLNEHMTDVFANNGQYVPSQVARDVR